MTVNKLTSPISQNDLINKTNEIIDNLGGGTGSISDVKVNGTSVVSDGVANIECIQKDGGSASQTISLTNGTGTTALGLKSRSTSSYISLSGSNGWLGSYGVSSAKRAVFYNGVGYTLAYTSEIPTVDQTYDPTSADAQSGVAVAEAIASGKDVFIATYGTTTYQEIVNAYNSNKIVYCTYDETGDINYNCAFILTDISSSYAHFGSITYTKSREIFVNNSNIWAVSFTKLQDTSTAVTHTANTAVGNSYTPVYINNSGAATPTSYTIQNARFDGQWIKKSSVLTTSTAVGSYNISLSSYISTPAGQYYEVLFHYHAFKNGAGNGTIYTDLVGDVSDIYSAGWQGIYVTANSRQADGWFIMPISPSNYYVYLEINSAFTEFGLTALAYRRIGTNT